jgi:hypothetical protein
MVQPAWHATVLVGFSGNSLEVHQLLPEADEGSKIKCFREEVAEILISSVHVHCLDKFGVTEACTHSCVASPVPIPAWHPRGGAYSSR